MLLLPMWCRLGSAPLWTLHGHACQLRGCRCCRLLMSVLDGVGQLGRFLFSLPVVAMPLVGVCCLSTGCGKVAVGLCWLGRWIRSLAWWWASHVGLASGRTLGGVRVCRLWASGPLRPGGVLVLHACQPCPGRRQPPCLSLCKLGGRALGHCRPGGCLTQRYLSAPHPHWLMRMLTPWRLVLAPLHCETWWKAACCSGSSGW